MTEKTPSTRNGKNTNYLGTADQYVGLMMFTESSKENRKLNMMFKEPQHTELLTSYRHIAMFVYDMTEDGCLSNLNSKQAHENRHFSVRAFIS